MDKHLTVYSYDRKERIGKKHDGGYVICDIGSDYDCYISCGVSDNAYFDKVFLESFPRIKKENSFAFDGTIDDYPWHFTKDINFFRKNISNFNDDKHTNMYDIIDRYEKIFLSMDIEGGEYPWLLNLPLKKLDKFKQIGIKFHGINDDTWGTSLDDKIKCLQKLNETHYIMHAHGNNCSRIRNGIPDVLELTYVNKKYLQNIPEKNKILMPIEGLDYPNRNVPDYILSKDCFIEKNSLYITFINNPPEFVFDNWKKTNPRLKIEFSKDRECKLFIKKYFGQKHLDLFNSVTRGAYKADLWRYCKLYINGGYYSDVDLVPLRNINFIDDSIDFCSVLALSGNQIFQAFMYVKNSNNIILKDIIERMFNINENRWDWPVFDFYNYFKENGLIIQNEGIYMFKGMKILILQEKNDDNSENVYFKGIKYFNSRYVCYDKENKKFNN